MKQPAKFDRRKKSAIAGANSARSADQAAGAGRSFPVVGIGASAGGLEALELFLQNVPAGSGMAYVIVQHQDPTHKGLMPELLQRATAMEVIQVKDRTRVKPNRVYVIPPNKDMSISHRTLRLLDPVTPRGLRLPIDFFFRSLADDLEDLSIGVILSGMGSDGTLGLKAVKGKAGVGFVQYPASAKFDGMPRSAIDAGLADVVAPPELLPARIVAYQRHLPVTAGRSSAPADDKAQSAFEKVVILLRAQTGHDFSLYKKSTVYRRIERRMGIHRIDRIANYVRYLRKNLRELELLFEELLIGVTSFFRDPEAWTQLQAEVVPALLKGRTPSQVLRAWVPGCSTGEEAYSLAIVFLEALEQPKPARGCTVQIFATDLDRNAIDKARAGVYPANIAADLSAERLARYFVPVEGGYKIAKPVREMVIFAAQNLVMEAPFTKLDLLSCRNLLIYLTPELQKKLLPLFHYSLNPGGFLFLGNAETVGEFTDLFAPLKGKWRLYRRLTPGLRAERAEFPTAFVASRRRMPSPEVLPPPQGSLQSLVEQRLLRQYAPAAVLASDKGDIFYISGRTGKYLEPAAGKANLNLFAMAREGLRYELHAAFKKALQQKGAAVARGVRVESNEGMRAVELSVEALAEPQALRGLMMVVFSDVALPAEAKRPASAGAPGTAQARLAGLERELAQARQESYTSREELQTFQEEAKSATEELQATNEELQSTNEELTTSKEEIQSMNEELQVLNQELQNRVDNLSRVTNDMKNLLDSTEIATVFLDQALRVRQFSAGSSTIFKLIPGDVGRPITDIACALHYPELAADAAEVLRTLILRERQVATRDGRWYAVRVLPYRTYENMIDGVVITFSNITAFKVLEAKLRKKRAEPETARVKQASKGARAAKDPAP